MKNGKIVSLILCFTILFGAFAPASLAVTAKSEGIVEQLIEIGDDEDQPVEPTPGFEVVYPEPEPVDPDPEPTPEPEPELTLFERFMTCVTLDEILALRAEISDEEWNSLTEEEQTLIEAYIEQLRAAEVPVEIDVEALYQQFMALGSLEEMEAFLAGLSQAELEALIARVSEEDLRILSERFGIDLIGGEEEIHTPAVNYTWVGGLFPPVMVEGGPQARNSLMDEDDGLDLSKVAVYDPETGLTKITIEAFTTGTVTSSTQSIPADVVLVLDASRSMDEWLYDYTEVYPTLNQNNTYYVKVGNSYIPVYYCGSVFSGHSAGWYTQEHGFFQGHGGTWYDPKTSAGDNNSNHVQFYNRTEVIKKRPALIAAATNFANSVHADAVANTVDHRVAVVTFANNNAAAIQVGLKNDMRDATIKDGVITAINNIGANGGTYIEDGMTKAKEAFDYPADPTPAGLRNRVVIVFTDGIPGSGTWNTTTINNSANPAIATSRTLKGSSYGATVYTIGMLDGANPGAAIDTGDSNDARTNRFLHYLSSNFPNASGLDSPGTGGGIGGGYYLSAGDGASLNAIFQNISNEISNPTVSLTGGTVIDYISPYFNVPAGASAINLYTAAYNGTDFEDRVEATDVSATVVGDKITVSGFDFDANFVSDVPRGTPAFYGRKLIIEFTVSVKEGFLGGNGVPTNGTASGVYDEDGDLVKPFVPPTVDLPIPDIDISIADDFWGSYLHQAVTQEAIELATTVKIGNNPADLITLDYSQEYYGLQAWQIAYVDIEIVLTPADLGQSLTDVTSDINFTLKGTISPKNAGTYPAKSDEGTGTILLFTPKLPYKDSTFYYGESVASSDYGAPNLVGKTWVHNPLLSSEIDHNDANLTMLNAEPELSVVYTIPSNKIVDGKIATKQDIPVKAEAYLEFGATPAWTLINDDTTFVHLDCDPECDWDYPAGSSDPAFLLHVKTGSLTITKAGGSDGVPYVFNIYKDGAKYSEATIVGNGSVTIGELPLGEYAIIEDIFWSWRFTPGYSGPVELTKASPTGTLTCTNASNGKNQWLNGYSPVETNIRVPEVVPTPIP